MPSAAVIPIRYLASVLASAALWFTFSICLSLLNKWLFGRPNGVVLVHPPASSLPLLTTSWHMLLHFGMSWILLTGLSFTWIWRRFWRGASSSTWLPLNTTSSENSNANQDDDDEEWIQMNPAESTPAMAEEPVQNKHQAHHHHHRVSLPNFRYYLTRLLPCAAATALDVGLSNSSLQYITLTHYTLLKSSTPLFVLLCACSLNVDGMPSSGHHGGDSNRSPNTSTVTVSSHGTSASQQHRSRKMAAKRRWQILLVILGMCLGVMLMVYREHGSDATDKSGPATGTTVTHSGGPVVGLPPKLENTTVISVNGSVVIQPPSTPAPIPPASDKPPSTDPGANPFKTTQSSFYWWLGIGMVLTATVMSALRWALTQLLLQQHHEEVPSKSTVGHSGIQGGTTTAPSTQPLRRHRKQTKSEVVDDSYVQELQFSQARDRELTFRSSTEDAMSIGEHVHARRTTDSATLPLTTHDHGSILNHSHSSANYPRSSAAASTASQSPRFGQTEHRPQPAPSTTGPTHASKKHPPIIRTVFLLSPLMSACLFLMSLIIERPFQTVTVIGDTPSGDKTTTLLYDYSFMQWVFMSSGATLAFCMILSEYQLITLTSAVTLSVAGMVKELLTLLVAFLVFNDRLTVLNSVGMVITLISIGFYNYIKYLDMKEQQAFNERRRDSDILYNPDDHDENT